ncbi:MAG: hypothetical protein EAZ27_02270 [Cytophagales bacterium]|nr:MAG: hypothetical protein EAZ27_02270 [Cytophagales bacterium]
MQHLLISVSDNANLGAIQSLLLQTKGIERVETIENDNFLESETDWINNLHKPGPKLTEAQLDELVQAMDNEEDTGISETELDKKFNAYFFNKWGIQIS